MKKIIIMYRNGKLVENITRELNSALDVRMSIVSVMCYVEQKMQNIISAGYPYQNMDEEYFKGFISDCFQVILTKNYIEFSEDGTTTQIMFSHEAENEALPILAA